jgi:hypothetical protein
MFTLYANAGTDLEALRLAFDSNKDNIFDIHDDVFYKFGVWQDINEDGINQADEYQTLQQMGIDSISLISDNTISYNEGNVIFGNTMYTKVDGTQGSVADVGLRVEIVANPIDMTSGIEVDPVTTVTQFRVEYSEYKEGEGKPSAIQESDILQPQNQIDLSSIQSGITELEDSNASEFKASEVISNADPAQTSAATVVQTETPTTRDVTYTAISLETENIAHQLTSPDNQNTTGSMG